MLKECRMRWLWWWWEYRGEGSGTIPKERRCLVRKYSSQSCHCFYLLSLCALFVSIWVSVWAAAGVWVRPSIYTIIGRVSGRPTTYTINTIQSPYKYHTNTIQSTVENTHTLHTRHIWNIIWPNGKVRTYLWEYGVPFPCRRWLVHWAYCSYTSSDAAAAATHTIQYRESREQMYKGKQRPEQQ